jgi:hypothetical protein
MRSLSPEGKQRIADIAKRHGFSVPATLAMLDALIKGNGTMAQFNDPEFAGPGQWMKGGMTMVSDMFNNRLRARVDTLCSDLSEVLANEPGLARRGNFQAQTQGSAEADEGRQGGARSGSNDATPTASIFVPSAHADSGEWWPAELGVPTSTGAQDGARYAYFDTLRRLAIDIRGTITVFDTLDHRITGFSQQQAVGGSISFTSQHGLVNVAKLPVVAVSGA